MSRRGPRATGIRGRNRRGAAQESAGEAAGAVAVSRHGSEPPRPWYSTHLYCIYTLALSRANKTIHHQARPTGFVASSSHARPLPSLLSNNVPSRLDPIAQMPWDKTKRLRQALACRSVRLYRVMAPLRFSRTWSRPWRPQKTRKACVGRQRGMESGQRRRSGPTHGVDDDGGENSARYGHAVFRVVGAADKLFVAGAVEDAEDAEDDDGEDGDDGAAGSASARAGDKDEDGDGVGAGPTHHDHACMALTTGFMTGRRVRARRTAGRAGALRGRTERRRVRRR